VINISQRVHHNNKKQIDTYDIIIKVIIMEIREIETKLQLLKEKQETIGRFL
jgi:hypothetical protein